MARSKSIWILGGPWPSTKELWLWLGLDCEIVPIPPVNSSVIIMSDKEEEEETAEEEVEANTGDITDLSSRFVALTVVFIFDRWACLHRWQQRPATVIGP
jgi:hypothetical protein